MQDAVPWYRQKWVKITGIAVAVTTAVAIIIGTVLVVVIRNSPQMIVADAITHSLDSPGIYTVKSGDIDGRLWAKNEQYQLTGTYDGIPIDVISNASMLYVKTAEPQKLFDKITTATSFGVAQSMIRKTIGTIQDKWLAVNLQTKTVSLPVLDQVQCVMDIKDQLMNTKTRSELAGLGDIVAITTLDDQNGSVRYQLAPVSDTARQAAFTAKLKQGRLYQALGACGLSGVAADRLQKVSAEMTIAKPVRQMTKLVLNDADGHKTEVTADYHTDFKISAPTDTIDANQLAGGIFGSLLRSYLQGR